MTIPSPRRRRRGAALRVLASAPVLLAVLLLSGSASQAVGGVGAATDGGAAAGAGAKRPNIVMVMADDMRVDDLRFAPHVRRLLGRHGVTFQNSFSPYPLCCPARASFLTGVYAHNHGVYWHEKPYGYAAFDDSRTLATSLRAAGYRTAFIGKYLNGYGPATSKVSGGPSWRYVPRGWTDWVGAFENPGVRGIHGGTYYYFDTPYNVNGTVDNSYRGRYQTDVVGDFSVDLAHRYHGSARPFFMYVSYVAPHHGAPGEPDDPHRVHTTDGVFDDFSTPARPDWVKGRFDHLIRRPSGMPRDGGPAEADVSDKPSFFRRLPELTRRERVALTQVTRQRAEAVYVMDRQVGRLARELKRTGEWEDTVFMFTSDNGYFLGEHRQRTGKVRAHEPSLRVPFLVTGPGLRDGSDRYDPITTVDISATVVELAGARPPRRPDGTSRVTTLRQGDQGWTVPVLTEATHTLRAPRTAPGFAKHEARTSIGLRTPRYSFTVYKNGVGELYDLENDPQELDNVFDDPDHRATRELLTRAWWELKDCAGRTCRASLPPGLSATATAERRLTRHYWEVIDDTYGR